jgi:hypothetical protein
MPIKPSIILRRLLNAHSRTNNKPRPRPPTRHQPQQLRHRLINIHRPRNKAQPLRKELRSRELQIRTINRRERRPATIRLRIVHPDPAEAALGGEHGDGLLEDDVRGVGERGVERFEADAVDGAADAGGFAGEDGGDGVHGGEVDGDGADGLGEGEARGFMVDLGSEGLVLVCTIMKSL